MKRIVTLLVAAFMATTVLAQPLAKVSPESVGLNPKMLAEADKMIAEAAAKKDFPGAVFAVVRHGKLAHLEAFGDKQWLPEEAPMKTNTIFDLASVSKPTSTAVSMMILVERGKIRLTDKVKDYLPGFQGYATEKGDTIDIRIADLLTHSSGLPAYAPVATVVEQGGAGAEEDAHQGEQNPFLQVGDTLTESFILALPDEAQQEACNALNRRTEFRVMRTTFGLP